MFPLEKNNKINSCGFVLNFVSEHMNVILQIAMRNQGSFININFV